MSNSRSLMRASSLVALFSFDAPDGTAVAGWRNDGDGIPVVISNGLGTSPMTWPTIAAPDSGFRVATWYYRGTGGGTRPADESRVAIEDHVEDLLALMDHEGMEQILDVVLDRDPRLVGRTSRGSRSRTTSRTCSR